MKVSARAPLRLVVWRREPLPASRSAGAGWRSWARGAARRFSCWRVSPCRHARSCAMWGAGGGGKGPQSRRPPRRHRLVAWHWLGGGGGGGWRRRQRSGSAVNGQWSAGQWDSLAACIRVPRAAGARPSPPPSPGQGVTLVLPPRGLRGVGGGHSGSGRLGLPGGGPGSLVRCHPPCSLPGVRGPACWGSGHGCRAWPSAAPSLAWGLGLRQRRVPRAVARVCEGGAHGPG